MESGVWDEAVSHVPTASLASVTQVTRTHMGARAETEIGHSETPHPVTFKYAFETVSAKLFLVATIPHWLLGGFSLSFPDKALLRLANSTFALQGT